MADEKIDDSSLSDAQRQQQQQHEQYVHQQPQIQQHHSHDPSQVQAYDANHVYYDHQQQHYAYTQYGYPNSYQQQMAHHEPVPLQSVQPEQHVGVAVSQNGTSQAGEGSVGEAQLQVQQNVYNPQQQRQVTAEALAAIAANPALDPNAAAAVSALAQLTKYAGTMSAAERASAAMQLQQLLGSGEGFGPMMDQFFSPTPLVGQPPFIGGHGGRIGGRLFRGGDRGNGRGFGRGRAGKRRFSSDSSQSTVSQPDPSAGDKVELSEQIGPSVAEVETVPSASVPTSVMICPQPGPSLFIWRCDLCNVDCNSAEILEQHKNGKKHKKNMQKTGVTFSVEPESQQVDKIEQPADSAQASEEKLVAGAECKIASGSRGRKRPRICEPPKPVIPIICGVCNIKCDTQEVFDRHLAGKKHLSKVKRYGGHQAMYVPNAQAHYPPNPIAQQPYYHPQVPQQPFYGTQSMYPPYDQYMPHEAHNPAAADTATPTDHNHPQNYTTVGTMPLNM